MKELDLTSWELLQLYMVVSAQTGTAGEMRRWWNILDLLEPDDDEKAQLGWRDTPEGIFLALEDFDHHFELELPQVEFDWIVKLVSEYNGWRAGGMGGGNRHRLRELFDKLGID